MQFHSELWNLNWYFGSLGPVLPPDLGLDPRDTLPSFRRVLRGDTVFRSVEKIIFTGKTK
jgi:hypothetical protein